MRRISMTAAVLLLCAAWALGQGYPSGQTSSGSSGQASVQGCLDRSGTNYTLTDKSGTIYQLSGDTSKLSEHVGHEVEIAGTPSGSSASANFVHGRRQCQRPASVDRGQCEAHLRNLQRKLKVRAKHAAIGQGTPDVGETA